MADRLELGTGKRVQISTSLDSPVLSKATLIEFIFTGTLVWADGGEFYGDYGPIEGRGGSYCLWSPQLPTPSLHSGERARGSCDLLSQRSPSHAEDGWHCVGFPGDNV